MKFGKLTSIEGIDFKLPDTPPATQSVLEASNPLSSANCFVGCTGWSMKEWVGKVYPPKTSQRQFFHHYSRQFNTIELNSTHYRIPSPSTLQKWREESPEDFRFCPKVLQQLSHRQQLGIHQPTFHEFWRSILGLGDKLGCCFLQLPPYFGKDRLTELQQFLASIPSEVSLAVEFRHESWFADEEAFLPAFEALKKVGANAVITDVAGRRDVLHHYLPIPEVFVRFVGNGLHATDYTRIDAWVERLEEWREAGLQRVWFFPHEPDNLLAPELSVYLVAQIEKRTGFNVRGPKLWKSQHGQQGSLF